MGLIDDTRAEAERKMARRREGKPLNLTPEELAQKAKDDDERLEREIQRDIVKLYRANGCTVYETSQKKRVKEVTPGVSDLIVFHHRTKSFWFHEVKTPTGQLEPSQRNFKEDCDICLMPYILGGLQAAQTALDAFVVSRENPNRSI